MRPTEPEFLNPSRPARSRSPRPTRETQPTDRPTSTSNASICSGPHPRVPSRGVNGVFKPLRCADDVVIPAVGRADLQSAPSPTSSANTPPAPTSPASSTSSTFPTAPTAIFGSLTTHQTCLRAELVLYQA